MRAIRQKLSEPCKTISAFRADEIAHPIRVTFSACPELGLSGRTLASPMALLPPFFLDTVVAIGVGADPEKRIWCGTGFIFGNLVAPQKDQETRSYRLWLITNKHVLKKHKEVFIKLNSAKEPNSKDYRVELIARNGRPRWIGHPNADTDVSAIFLPAGFLRQEERKFNYFRSDDHICTKQKMTDQQLTEGDRVFVLGFPMGLVATERQYVICRSGIIARVRDFIDGSAADFLVDATVFPGNSGGPIVICPSAIAITGTKQIKKADLIGMVKSYVPYNDVAISQQTGRPRIIFEENSGLTAVEPVDAIVATVALAEKRLKGRAAQAKTRTKRPEQETKTPPQPAEQETKAQPHRDEQSN